MATSADNKPAAAKKPKAAPKAVVEKAASKKATAAIEPVVAKKTTPRAKAPAKRAAPKPAVADVTEVTGTAGVTVEARVDAPVSAVAPSSHHAMIAERAFLIAEANGFEPNRELEYWLAAEQEVALQLARAQA